MKRAAFIKNLFPLSLRERGGGVGGGCGTRHRRSAPFVDAASLTRA